MIGCYDRAAEGSRGTIMIYLRLHFGRSLRCNANARHWNVFIVPLFPLWIIGAFCVKDSEYNDTTSTDARRTAVRALRVYLRLPDQLLILCARFLWAPVRQTTFDGRKYGVCLGRAAFFVFPATRGRRRIVFQWGWVYWLVFGELDLIFTTRLMRT